jgi:hypothetical protein
MDKINNLGLSFDIKTLDYLTPTNNLEEYKYIIFTSNSKDSVLSVLKFIEDNGLINLFIKNKIVSIIYLENFDYKVYTIIENEIQNLIFNYTIKNTSNSDDDISSLYDTIKTDLKQLVNFNDLKNMLNFIILDKYLKRDNPGSLLHTDYNFTKTINIEENKIDDIIGPGGKNIKKLMNENNVRINIEESINGSKLIITSQYHDNLNKVEQIIKEEYLTDLEFNKNYNGVIEKIFDFGAFVKIGNFDKVGLLHISEFYDDSKKIYNINDCCKVNDKIKIQISEIGDNGKIKLKLAE